MGLEDGHLVRRQPQQHWGRAGDRNRLAAGQKIRGKGGGEGEGQGRPAPSQTASRSDSPSRAKPRGKISVRYTGKKRSFFVRPQEVSSHPEWRGTPREAGASDGISQTFSGAGPGPIHHPPVRQTDPGGGVHRGKGSAECESLFYGRTLCKSIRSFGSATIQRRARSFLGGDLSKNLVHPPPTLPIHVVHPPHIFGVPPHQPPFLFECTKKFKKPWVVGMCC